MKVLKKVSKREAIDFLFRDLDLKDSKIYEEANSPDKIGIFQMVGGTASFMIEKIKPKNFDELNACNAFARPGTMDFVDQYVYNRDNEYSTYPDKIKEILSTTNSVILFQEQVMEIFNKIGGFSLEETNNIRGLMKKLGKLDKDPEDLKKWDKVLLKFKKGAINNGISEKEADLVAEDLLKMSSYSFNNSHSVSYTYIAVITLYLSVYFRKYFYSSVLEYEVDRDKYLVERLVTVANHGFEILPPDINLSKDKMSPLDGNKIIFGLKDVKGVGDSAVPIILEKRPYKDFFDFIIKTRSRGVSSAVIKALIKIGAFDNLINGERKKYLHAFNTFWDKRASTKVVEKLEQLWKDCLSNSSRIPLIETKQSDLMEYEKDVLGFNFFISPFTPKRIETINLMRKRSLAYYDFADVTSVSKKIAVSVSSVRTIIDKNGNEMAFVEIDDINRNRKTIPIFASYWKVIGSKILSARDKIVLINVYLDDKNSIMFGQRGYVNDELKILRMIMEMP